MAAGLFKFAELLLGLRSQIPRNLYLNSRILVAVYAGLIHGDNTLAL